MGHDHAYARRTADNKRRLGLVFVMTTAYLVAEVVGALVTGSLALLADAGHMLTDVAGLALALVGIKLAERPPNSEKTYGYYRVEILAALTNAVFLVGISLYILYEAYERISNPPRVESAGMLAVAGVGLVVNLVGLKILKTGSQQNLNMKGAYFEVLSDLLTSVAVIIAGAIMWVTEWYFVDPILSAGIGLFIFPRTWRLLREAVDVLLEGTPADINLAALREAIGGLNGVAGVHDLHVWSLTSGVNAMSVHVVLANGATHHEVLDTVRKHVTGHFPIGHVTVQIELVGCAERETHL